VNLGASPDWELLARAFGVSVRSIGEGDEVADALAVLGPRDRQVVELRFFDERLQREIGRDIGVSQMQVSRILNRAMLRMRDHLDDDESTDDPTLAA
jgi:RNA polymerase sigma-B factor